jgi:hypothetical protein
MIRTATPRTVPTLMLASTLGVAAAGLARPAPAAGPCPLASEVHTLHERVMAERAPALRPALFTYADADLAETPPALSADPHWSRLAGAAGLRLRGSRL